MSGNVSVVAFEGELNSIVREYLDFSGFDRTKAVFEDECSDRKKPISKAVYPSFGNEKLLLVQNQMLEFMNEGRGDLFFKLWNEYLPTDIKDEDNVSQKLEFYLQIYFAIYPVKYNQSQIEREEGVSKFKTFLENRGSALSQTTEFLPFYALPYVPNPKAHPSYGELFSEKWSSDLKGKVEKFLSSALKSMPHPRLFDIYKCSLASGKGVQQQQMALMSQQVVEAEKKAASYLKRHSRVQADYHNLISITADLVDALEATVQGRPITPEYLQKLCNRLFSSHMRTSVDISRPGTAGEVLRASIIPQSVPVADQEETYPPLDFTQVKGQLIDGTDRKKALILQALRWRLTRTRAQLRDHILSEYIQNDILGCTNQGQYRVKLMKLLISSSDVVKQYLARLYNACASMCSGRGYLAMNPELLPSLMDILHGDKKDNIAQEMVLGTLQKLSLRRQLQTAMIDRGVIEWLVGVLEDNDSLSDYTLEYSVALLMNLCLRTAGKMRCKDSAHQTLKILSDLLGHDNTEIRPYVNGALYSILAISSIREEAKAMGMDEILHCFYKEDQPDMNRQIDFIIQQLNSNVNGEEAESDDEDEDEDAEEDQEMLEADLDKDEVIRQQPGELVGERLLAQYALSHPPSSASRMRKKLSGDEPLQRPTTPGSRRAQEQVNHNVSNNVVRSTTKADGHNRADTSRPVSRSEDIVRPPTRSGSRPASQQSSSSDLRGSNPGVDKTMRPSTKALEKMGSEVNLNEYRTAFKTNPKIPRTPDSSQPTSSSRSAVRGSLKEAPQPQFSESGPRPSSAGKSCAPGSPRKASVVSKEKHKATI